MRIVKDIPDIQRALNELFAFKDRISTKDWDFKGLRIKNASPGVDPTDYATLNQLPNIPVSPTAPLKYYTVVFESPTVVTAGTRISPGFRFGKGRTGTPVQVWLDATNLPTSGPLAINVQLNGNNLLTTDLVLNVGDTPPAVSSTFLASARAGYLASLLPTITTVGGAGLISIGIVIQLDV